MRQEKWCSCGRRAWRGSSHCWECLRAANEAMRIGLAVQFAGGWGPGSISLSNGRWANGGRCQFGGAHRDRRIDLMNKKEVLA